MIVLGMGIAVAARAESAWVRVESDNFVLYSHAGQDSVFDTAIQLEGFRAAIQAEYPDLVEGVRRPPLPVIAFTGPDELSQFLTPPRRGDETEPGLYRTTGNRPLVAVDLTRWGPSSRVLYRAYVDGLLQQRTRAPLWLRVGLASFFATTTVDGAVATLGHPSRETLDALKDGKWIRLDDVLTADRELPGDRQAMFEAESWLLVHWCLLDPEGERDDVVSQLVSPSMRNVDPSALLNPLSMPRAWLTEQLRTYFADASRPGTGGALDTFRTMTVDLTGRFDPANVQLVQVPEVEVEYRLGEVLTAERQLEEAEVMFQHALQLDPQSWMPYDGLALLASANFRWGDARRLYTEAVSRDPTLAGPFLDHGRTVTSGVHGKAANLAAREAYEAATALDPSALEAYASLSELAYRDKDFAESGRWAGRGLQVDPRDSKLRALLGRAQFASGDLAHAKVNTQIALQECRDPRACSEATSLLRVVLDRLPETTP